MQIKKLSLYNWRNFNSLSLDLSPRITFIHGQNGTGKTNLLESIWYLAYSRSFRKANDSNLIRFGESKASILGMFEMDGNEYDKSVSIQISKYGKKVEVDNKKVKTLSSYVGTILISAFDPKKVFFFKNEPAERRKTMDETLSAIYPEYLYSLSRYKKILKERNQIIYQNGDEDILNVLTQKLIKFSYQIVIHRNELIEYLNIKANMYFHHLFPSGGQLKFKYKTNAPVKLDYSPYQEEMMKRFEENKSKENIRRMTVIGPHFDDLIGSLDEAQLSNFASQGQNRLASLAVVLALKDLMEEKKHQIPILLLDDVFSDLDSNKRKLLSELLQNKGQVVITGNQDERYEGFNYIEVKDGKIIQGE